MDIVLQSLIHHKAEMGRLGTVTICIGALVIVSLDGVVEYGLGVLYVVADLGQVSKLKRCTVLFDDIHQVYAIEEEVVVFNIELFCRKVKSLLNQVFVFVHFLWLRY